MACLPPQAPLTQDEDIASDIVFFKTDENYILQQHLVYMDGRPYFNFSFCTKEQGEKGFNTTKAFSYDLKKHCYFLGQWMPVYGPLGENIIEDLFLPAPPPLRSPLFQKSR